jgi:membrane-associated HD superfamily phosphohydrolase
MKNKTKYFIYFIIAAPILAKIIEWLFQIVSFNGLSHLANGVWFFQIIFIVTISIILSLIFGYFEIKNIAPIVGIAYFLKELYNLIFISSSFTYSNLIALTIEPIFMYTILGVFLPKLLFKDLRGRCR